MPIWQPFPPLFDDDTNIYLVLPALKSAMPSRKPQDDHGGNLALVPEKKTAKPPPLFKVLLLNDDYTPMDFVVVVLQKFFAMSAEQATIVMLQVHRLGKGVCGIYPHDVADTKVRSVAEFARKYQHPLACVMEEM